MRYAIEKDRLEALKLLVDHGAIIDTVNSEKIKEIEEQGRDLKDVNPAEYNYDFPPVQFAFMNCSFECAEYLLEKAETAAFFLTLVTFLWYQSVPTAMPGIRVRAASIEETKASLSKLQDELKALQKSSAAAKSASHAFTTSGVRNPSM